MAIGQNFYQDQDYGDIENLSRRQSGQALQYGDQAARYADPFMAERGKYQKQLSDLMADPGSFASSPTYKFAYDQGLEALHRKGGVRSGAKLAQLQQYGQGMASQQFNNQAKLLSDLAMSGSSPGNAGAAYARGADRSQDYGQLAAAARATGNMGNRGGSSTLSGQPIPFWNDPNTFATQDAERARMRAEENARYGLPSGGYGSNGALGNTGGLSLSGLGNYGSGYNGGYSDEDWNYAFGDDYGDWDY